MMISKGISAPIISVCVPTYNYGRFLPDAIESVLAQDFADFEIVITDDASIDGTVDLVERYQARDRRIRLIKNETRLGMAGNIAHAANLGRGRFIKMLCADDWLTPTCLSRMVALFSTHPSAVLATSACIATAADGRPQEVNFIYGRNVTFQSGDEMLARMSRGEGFGGNSSFCFRRDAYQQVGGYDITWPYASDYDLAARLCRIGDYLHTDEPLFYGRNQPDSSSATNPAKLLDVPDWFQIPARVFHPRPWLSRSFFRYQRLTGMLTARYLVTVSTQYARGRREYAKALAKLLVHEGNFLVGIPLIPVEAARRVMNRLTGKHRPRSRPTEPWMGPPHRTTFSARLSPERA